MHMTRGKIIFVLIAAAALFGWKYLSGVPFETAVLHIPAEKRSQDTYVTLWFVSDAQSLWIRAESRKRLWLTLLENNPQVELKRNGRISHYRAYLFDDPGSQAYVDAMFLAKYGPVDRARAFVLRRDAVPIRLESL